MDPHAIAGTVVPNLRDLGGRPTADGGVVARGVVYRSGELSAAAGDHVLAGLGIRTVLDLRTAAERAARPDTLPLGARLVELDVLGGATLSAAVEVKQLFDRADEVATALAATDTGATMRAVYEQLVVAPSALDAYRAVVLAVIAHDRRPLLVHCTAGKDRTGWAATVLLLAAGVDEDGAMEEFLAVNPSVRATFAPLLAPLSGDVALLTALSPLLEVREEYLGASLAALHDRFGTVEDYLRDGLGLDDGQRAELRRVLRGGR